MMVATSLRFGLDMPAQAVPRRQVCPCGWHGGATVAHAHTAEERHATNAAHREWALHALTCSKGAGKRGVVHDWLSAIFQVMLANAGVLHVELEDVWWDVGAAYGDEDHRRPDITCEHPTTHAKYVFDLVVWWGASAGLDEWGGSKAAAARERWKVRRHRRAMWARHVEQMSPEAAVVWADSDAEPDGGDWT
jgi:hypothetical protein